MIRQTARGRHQTNVGAQVGGVHADTVTVAIARVNLRDMARKVEEAAVLLEGAGYQAIPGELMTVSERLTELRMALERVRGTGRERSSRPGRL
jgi:hypothetical protein